MEGRRDPDIEQATEWSLRFLCDVGTGLNVVLNGRFELVLKVPRSGAFVRYEVVNEQQLAATNITGG